MTTTSKIESGLAAEFRIIPRLAWALAAFAFVVTQVFFNIVALHFSDMPPVWARIGLGLGAGIVLGCYVLFLGYVSRDSQRRGMNPWLWTIVAIVIPHGLGLILYFILRQPLPGFGATTAAKPAVVEAALNYCPNCRFALNPSCPSCQRPVGVNDRFCPTCGAALQPEAKV
jgi:hypothetical protein